MSKLVYLRPEIKPLVWLHNEVRTPPFSKAARQEVGRLLRRLQLGEMLQFPQSRPLPVIGLRCHELRISDGRVEWRIVYRIERDAVVILEVFSKKSEKTPVRVIETCRRRLLEYVRAR